MSRLRPSDINQAGTVLHRSQLPLTKWFLAAYLVAIHGGSVSARQLQTRLGIAYQTVWVLKRKLQLSKVPEDHEPLRGLVEVDHTEILFEAYSRTFARVMPDRMIVVIALEASDDEPTQAKPSAIHRSNRIRLEEIPDTSLASIEPFIRANVRRGRHY